jgi:hypothetical protein
VAEESAFVLAAEKLEMLLTPAARAARALGRVRGGRRYVAESSTITASRIPQRAFLVFMFVIEKVRC